MLMGYHGTDDAVAEDAVAECVMTKHVVWPLLNVAVTVSVDSEGPGVGLDGISA